MNIDLNQVGSNNLSYELLNYESNEAKFNVTFSIGWKERFIELAIAIIFSFPIVTLGIENVRQHWSSVFTGRKIAMQAVRSDQVDPYRWALLNKINQQKQRFNGKPWNEILQSAPEAFEFAPYSVKNDPQFAKLAVKNNAAMINHVGADLIQDLNFLKEVSKENPKIVFKLEPPLNKEIYESLSTELKKVINQQSETGIRPEDMEILRAFIEEYKQVWFDQLKNSDKPFLYLKKKFLRSDYAIQVFKDGRIWIHSGELVGRGTAMKVKAVYDWNEQKKYVKVAVQKHLRQYGFFTGGDRTQKVLKVYEKLNGKQGIVPLVDGFNYPSKSGVKGQKTVLILDRYTGSLEHLNKWTKEDLKVIALDLLHAVKAFKEEELSEGDFHAGNVLVSCDEKGRAVKAGLIDFEQTEPLSEVRKNYRDPRQADYELQNEIVRLLYSLYEKNGFKEEAKIFWKGYFQPAGEYGWAAFEKDIIPVDIDTLIQTVADSL